MCFRIDCEPGNNRIVLRVQGALVGWEAERLLRQEIVRAAATGSPVIVDVAEVTTLDGGCLAALETGISAGLSIQGGRAFLDVLLGK